jgi:hypothetical protein
MDKFKEREMWTPNRKDTQDTFASFSQLAQAVTNYTNFFTLNSAGRGTPTPIQIFVMLAVAFIRSTILIELTSKKKKKSNKRGV